MLEQSQFGRAGRWFGNGESRASLWHRQRENYAVTLVTGSWKINPAPVTATAGSLTGTYNGNQQSPSGCVVTPISPNTYVGAAMCTNSPVSVTNAGSGTVNPVLSYGSDSASNYAVTPATGSWNIAPAPVTATAGATTTLMTGRRIRQRHSVQSTGRILAP